MYCRGRWKPVRHVNSNAITHNPEALVMKWGWVFIIDSFIAASHSDGAMNLG
jgi:hypothetical protein